MPPRIAGELHYSRPCKLHLIISKNMITYILLRPIYPGHPGVAVSSIPRREMILKSVNVTHIGTIKKLKN